MNPKLLEHLRSLSEEEIYTALYTDKLTGALNRSAFSLKRYRLIGIVDMDSLKYLNDNCGHREGDKYLKKLVSLLKQYFGEHNVFRLGGDEFAITSCSARPGTMIGKFEEVRGFFPGFSYGIGTSLDKADAMLNSEKREREAQGIRASRGSPPSWIEIKI